MTLIDQVLELIHRQPDMPTQAMAQQLGVSEGDLVRALPASMVTLWRGLRPKPCWAN